MAEPLQEIGLGAETVDDAACVLLMLGEESDPPDDDNVSRLPFSCNFPAKLYWARCCYSRVILLIARRHNEVHSKRYFNGRT